MKANEKLITNRFLSEERHYSAVEDLLAENLGIVSIPNESKFTYFKKNCKLPAIGKLNDLHLDEVAACFSDACKSAPIGAIARLTGYHPIKCSNLTPRNS